MFETLEQCKEWVRDFQRKHSVAAVPIGQHGCRAAIMLARRLTGEESHPLPSGVEAPAYPVHAYAGCPSAWSAAGDAFFVPIPVGKDGFGPGMWYDWRASRVSDYDLAVVPSTTGMNPITGLKADVLRLERCGTICPVHALEFQAGRYCPTCAFSWPPQNYVCSPNVLWWDGFRRPDGTVRQFSFSNDILQRDVGVAVLGTARVPTFGFSYFRAKEARPRPVHVHRDVCYGSSFIGSASPCLDGEFRTIKNYSAPNAEPVGGGSWRGSGELCAAGSVPRVQQQAEEAIVAVGAGAKIRQALTEDPKRLDEWCEEPVASITVHFVSEEQAAAILNGPRRERPEKPEGYMDGLRVTLGNP